MIPDATKHDSDPEYLRELIDKIGVSQRKAASLIGVPERTFRDYLNRKGKSRAPYPVQFALECLAAQSKQQYY